MVGAPYEDDATTASVGKAYVHRTSNGELLYTLSNPALPSTYGYRVAASNTHAVISPTITYDASGQAVGAACLYRLSDGTLTRTIVNPNPHSIPALEAFGDSISMDSDNIVIGVPGSSTPTITGTGVVYIFRP